MCSVRDGLAVAKWPVLLLFASSLVLSTRADSVTLAWDSSTATDAASYKIYYGPSTGNYTNAINVGLTTTATISGLLPGSTYYLAATVTDTIGLESLFSSEISYTVPTTVTNQPPTLDPLPDITIAENAALQTVNLSGISSGAATPVQSLTVTASSSNPSLIPTPLISYISPNTNGTLQLQPVASAFGVATITVTVNNGGLSNNLVSRSFTVTVESPPTISAITNVVVALNSQTPAIPFTIGDSQTSVSNLTLDATSSNPSLVTSTNIFFGGIDTNRTVTIKPLSGQTGLAEITLTVSGAIASASTSFELTVLTKPSPPHNVHIAGH